MSDLESREPAAAASERRFLSRSTVAQLLEVSPVTVARWAREGKLPYVVTLGGRKRYPRELIEKLVQDLTLPRRNPA